MLEFGGESWVSTGFGLLLNCGTQFTENMWFGLHCIHFLQNRVLSVSWARLGAFQSLVKLGREPWVSTGFGPFVHSLTQFDKNMWIELHWRRYLQNHGVRVNWARLGVFQSVLELGGKPGIWTRFGLLPNCSTRVDENMRFWLHCIRFLQNRVLSVSWARLGAFQSLVELGREPWVSTGFGPFVHSDSIWWKYVIWAALKTLFAKPWSKGELSKTWCILFMGRVLRRTSGINWIWSSRELFYPIWWKYVVLA